MHDGSARAALEYRDPRDDRETVTSSMAGQGGAGQGRAGQGRAITDSKMTLIYHGAKK